ncbi:glycosyl hydrolase [Methanoculleus sp. FWC-SCC3]|uniref:Probable pectate lyase C n=2 Tax=Methanomicrobiaceae TaxID=2194 RepID=A0ABT8M439_9EURY|nr:glycosyl hydrolase [Methanoculleus sp. FWC-SCC3]
MIVKRTTRLIIAVFLVFGMVPFVGALEPGTATVTVAASDSTSAAKAQADYVCDGSNDQAEIQNAINALPASGGTVQLTEGTFNCAGSVLPKAHTTLSGQGDDKTFIRFTNDGILRVDTEYVTLENFHVEGTGYSASRDFGVVYIRAGHNAVRDVTGTADRTIQGLFYVRSVGLGNKNIEDIEFTRVVADSPGTYGFLHSSWGTDYKVHKNVRYTDCRAIDCGRYSAYNPWVTGFDFAELNDIENLRVTRCVAEGTLESGFHFEYGPTKKDIVLTDCISRNNGQKPFPKTYSLGGEDYFGSGYYAPKGSYTFNNCTAEGNSAYGFFFSYPDGVHLYDCTDFETGRGKTDYSAVKPTSFFIVQSQLTNANPSIVMEDCASINSHGRGLYATLVDYVQIKNFTMTNPGGIDGVGALIGDPALGVGFVSSNLDIHASGNSASRLVTVNSASNSKFTGSIVSDVATPFTVAGGGTNNVVVEGIKTVSNTLPVGSSGITTSSVNSGAVRITDCTVVKPGSAPLPTPVPTTPAPSGKPDLVVTDISWTPTNPASGDAVTMKATIKNQGDAPTPAGAKHGVLFTFDDGAAGPGIWSDAHTASIAPGSWVTVTANGGSSGATWKAVEGAHTVKAHVDDVNRIAESNDANNVRTEQITVSKTASGSTPTPTPTTPAPSGKPDLVVTGISWTPANPASGDAVTMKATIKNQGTAPTPAGTKHGVLFTFDDGAAGPGVWSDTYTSAIAPGASVTLTANGGSSGATWKAADGTHTVKAHVDDVNRIAESVEDNNVMSKEIVVGSLPVPVRGDLNGDGNVDWADVTIAAEMAQKTTPSDPAADVNGDGTVDWKDVALLTDFFFGRTSSL